MTNAKTATVRVLTLKNGKRVAKDVLVEILAATSAKAEAARELRDKLLAESDWTQLPDAPINASDWAAYRKKLRDVPAQKGFPSKITWPTLPA